MRPDNPSHIGYTGRFAPSPTGPLHFGSLIAALGSYLDARSHSGRWLVRIEDPDAPRVVPGAADAILRTLEHYGLEWDGAVLRQSQRGEVYQTAVEQLLRLELAYGCDCSRKQIAEATLGTAHSGVYPGRCRARHLDPSRHAVRLLASGIHAFADRLQGSRRQDLAREVGDFVIRRADGIFAYHLAVVVDDAAQGVTDIVRGADLLDSTPRQIHLQRLLGFATPNYLHLPLAVTRQGEKLSKQTGAPALELGNPVPLLWQALRFLAQDPPDELRHADRDSLLDWAVRHWQLDRLPPVRGLVLEDAPGEGER